MEERPVGSICDEKLFNELFSTHSKDLHDFLYYKFGGEHNPKDIVQEAFLKLWDNCHKVAFGKVRSFLFTVANNQMLNELSKKKTVLTYAQQKPKQHTIESPEYIMEENEYMNKLQSAIENLTEEQRVAFLLNRVEGKKHKEIAALLEISRKAVEKRIYTALKKLRDQVGDI
ncbi:MAG: sigma-70 family RNA polymerase sigma factor [Cyclobacteriaceae bacterium]|nr:sigma-70 family RNA polymerase sigma factor [Cyclobacteriaceae bacterium]MCK5278823.1 sigma-70 family RNA polymerase sigma factor [Cyclobacteriaceae bacterium]MCK5367830.1 sigma-70 family RNA polymerase sigma factor [Cyclobacteriaceae bacterium]